MLRTDNASWMNVGKYQKEEGESSKTELVICMVHNYGSWELSSLGVVETVRIGSGAGSTLEYGGITLGDGGNAHGAGKCTFGAVGSTLELSLAPLDLMGGAWGVWEWWIPWDAP